MALKYRPITKFIILTSGRTGSNTLRNYLNAVTGVRCHGEVFIRKYNNDYDSFKYYCMEQRKLENYYQYILSPRLTHYSISSFLSYTLIDKFLDFLFYDPAFTLPWVSVNQRRIYTKNEDFMNEYLVGFKVAYGSYNRLAGLRSWVKRNPDCKIVHLTRKNTLKKLVSWEVTKHFRLFHIEKSTEVTQPLVEIDPTNLLKRLQSMKNETNNFREKLLKLDNEIAEFTYEDLLLENQETQRVRLADFLSINYQDLQQQQMRYKKVNSNDLTQVIKNFQEVKKKIKGTEFEEFMQL